MDHKDHNDYTKDTKTPAAFTTLCALCLLCDRRVLEDLRSNYFTYQYPLQTMKKIYTIGHCTTSLALFEETGLNKLIGPKFTLQNIKFEKITPEQLDEMRKMAGSYEALFSRRAIKYKEWKLKDKKLTEKDYRKYILDEYTFLKRPVIIWDDKIFVGSEKKTVEAIKRELQ